MLRKWLTQQLSPSYRLLCWLNYIFGMLLATKYSSVIHFSDGKDVFRTQVWDMDSDFLGQSGLTAFWPVLQRWWTRCLPQPWEPSTWVLRVVNTPVVQTHQWTRMLCFSPSSLPTAGNSAPAACWESTGAVCQRRGFMSPLRWQLAPRGLRYSSSRVYLHVLSFI